jgi:hypothetical protein
MRKIITLSILSIFLISLVSADILLLEQPKKLYNFGDAVSLPVTVKTTADLSGTMQMNLICNGEEVNFYKNGISLSTGEEKKIDAALILSKEIIGELKGFCLIKIFLKDNIVITEEFLISNIINVELKTFGTEFNPEEIIYLEGDAFRETGKAVDGFVEINILSDNSSENKTYQGTVKNGFFSIDFAFPKETKSGKYFLKVNVYEKDELGEITNEGFSDYTVNIKQIPTSLELVFEEQDVEPGTNVKVRAILHDQTGEKIKSTAILTIKNEKNKILEQREIATDELLEFPIKYNEPPSEWSVFGVSNQISAQATFKIKESQKVQTEIMNKTLIITNIGNVPYNQTLLVKIGESSVEIDIFLKVDEIANFILSAPEGEYEVEIIENGESMVSKGVFLTGKAISVKEISKFGFRNYPMAWIFVILILGFVSFIVYKKGYKKSFFGYIYRKKDDAEIQSGKGSALMIKNKAEVSISLKGDKQSAILLCLKIKDLKEIEKEKSGIEQSLQSIINLVEENKGAVYENSEYMMFLFAPLMTKTFKNEKTVLKIAQRIKEIMIKHNKMFKGKTDFGISIKEAEIVAKRDENVLKFMSFGDAMMVSKKIATKAHNDILLSEKVKEKIHSIKTEKHKLGEMNIYEVKEVKSAKDEEEHKKFVGSFLKRLEKSD